MKLIDNFLSLFGYYRQLPVPPEPQIHREAPQPKPNGYRVVTYVFDRWTQVGWQVLSKDLAEEIVAAHKRNHPFLPVKYYPDYVRADLDTDALWRRTLDENAAERERVANRRVNVTLFDRQTPALA